MAQEYTQEKFTGYLLWLIGLLLDDVQNVVDTHPNNKPLETLTREEFAVENADMCAAVVYGALRDDLGIAPEKLIEISNGRHPMPDLEEFLKLCKKVE